MTFPFKMLSMKDRDVKNTMEPKVFISYSWSNQNHQELVKHLAEKLIADGVDVIMDKLDTLK